MLSSRTDHAMIEFRFQSQLSIRQHPDSEPLQWKQSRKDSLPSAATGVAHSRSTAAVADAVFAEMIGDVPVGLASW